MRGSIDLSPSGDGRRIAIIFAVGMLMFGVGGCSPDHSTQESTIPRTALDGTPRVIRLSNGACLDASRLPPPWILDPPTAPTDISFHATYAALGVPQPNLVRMARRPGDEQRRVLVDAGRLTAVNRDFYGVAPPARLNYLILNHQFLTPIPSPWSPQENRLSLSAFHINDENLYVSADRIIQCRDHLPRTLNRLNRFNRGAHSDPGTLRPVGRISQILTHSAGNYILTRDSVLDFRSRPTR